MRKYTQPRCTHYVSTTQQCERGADLWNDYGHAVCSLHTYVECACGRMVAERLAADGYPCSTCELERCQFDYEQEGW